MAGKHTEDYIGCGICRGMKKVNTNIRKSDERRRKRWRSPITRRMTSWTVRRETMYCADWRDRDTKRESTYTIVKWMLSVELSGKRKPGRPKG